MQRISLVAKIRSLELVVDIMRPIRVILKREYGQSCSKDPMASRRNQRGNEVDLIRSKLPALGTVFS